MAVIFIRKLCQAQKASLCGRFRKQRNPALARTRGPANKFLRHKRGLNLMLTTSKRQPRSLNREGTECSSRTRKNRGARLSAVSLRRRDYWSESPSRHSCERTDSASYSWSLDRI